MMKRKKEQLVSVGMRLPKSTIIKVDREAYDNRRSRAAQVALIIEDFCSRKGDQ